MKTNTFKKGSIITAKGIPFELAQDVNAMTSEDNYKLFLSQSEHSLVNPIQAASPVRAITNSESLESI